MVPIVVRGSARLPVWSRLGRSSFACGVINLFLNGSKCFLAVRYLCRLTWGGSSCSMFGLGAQLSNVSVPMV